MAGCWIAFGVVWLALFTRVKRDIDRPGSLWAAVGVRLVFVLAFILLIRLPPARHLIQSWFSMADPAVRVAGDVLCALGVAFSIWARANLGSNWSSQPAIKEGHDLVTSGAYHLVRHPIYSGMLIAMIGTALVVGVPGLLFLLGFVPIVIYRIRVEERLMMKLFGDQFLRYRKRTRMLIPYLI